MIASVLVIKNAGIVENLPLLMVMLEKTGTILKDSVTELTPEPQKPLKFTPFPPL
jgi:hypothetical protein